MQLLIVDYIAAWCKYNDGVGNEEHEENYELNVRLRDLM